MISIIVPVYNVEKYVELCIVSILNQTFRDIELILVDDGSNDGSGAICDQYAARDQRVRVIHKVNGGVSSARNEGMREARGEFICFIDGDDVIHPNMMEVLLNAINEADYDFSMCDIKRIREDEKIDIKQIDITGLSKRVLYCEDFCRRLYKNNNGEYYNYIVNKLYRRELVLDESFSELKMAEDIEWLHRVCVKIKHAVLIDADLYFYIQRGSSVTHALMNPRFLDWIRAYDLCLDNIPKDFTELRNNCLLHLYKVMALIRCMSRRTQYEQEVKTLNDGIVKKRKEEFRQSNVAWITKLRVLTFYHWPWTYAIFMKACDLVAKCVSWRKC